MFHVLAELPEVVIDAKVWKSLLSEHFIITQRNLNPQMFGFPNERTRHYSVSLLRKRFQPYVDICDADFEVLFFKPAMASGDIFFLNTAEAELQREKLLQHLASVRKLVEPLGPGKWVLSDVLNPLEAARLEGYHQMTEHEESWLCSEQAVIANISQDPCERPQVSKWVPTLLRDSHYVLLRGQGCGRGSEKSMLGDEAFLSMGWPVHAQASDKEMPCAIDAILPSLSEAQKRSLAGNGMSVPVIGSVLLFVLGCTRDLATCPPGALSDDDLD